MAREDGVLLRVSLEEARLVANYRVVNPVRQDALVYFSDELVKLEAQDASSSPNNVVLLHPQKDKDFPER